MRISAGDVFLNDFEEFFQDHPSPMALSDPVSGLKQVNAAAQAFWPTEKSASSGLTPSKFLSDPALSLNGKLISGGPILSDGPASPHEGEEGDSLASIQIGDPRVLRSSLFALSSGRSQLTLT